MSTEEFMNLEIGKTFKLGRTKFEIKELDEKNGNHCKECYFDRGNSHLNCFGIDLQEEHIIPYCHSLSRRDKKNIIFKEEE